MYRNNGDSFCQMLSIHGNSHISILVVKVNSHFLLECCENGRVPDRLSGYAGLLLLDVTVRCG